MVTECGKGHIHSDREIVYLKYKKFILNLRLNLYKFFLCCKVGNIKGDCMSGASYQFIEHFFEINIA